MRRSRTTAPGNGTVGERIIAGYRAKSMTSAVDLGLELSVYGKHEDGSLYEIGDTASPLARQSAAGTWPTEQ